MFNKIFKSTRSIFRSVSPKRYTLAEIKLMLLHEAMDYRKQHDAIGEVLEEELKDATDVKIKESIMHDILENKISCVAVYDFVNDFCYKH